MSDWKSRTGPMRVPFLILTPACVSLGYGTAVWSTGGVSFLHFLLALVGAVAAHVSVNALNEYHDFRSGLDRRTERTPFSGGSGTLPRHPEMAGTALATGVIALGIVLVVGLYFLTVWGLALLPLGVAGAVLIAAYTPWLTRSPLLCLLAPGLGFGTFMVMGTHFVLTGAYSWTAFAASLVPFFLVSDLLLLNQFPDVEADRGVGRKHLPITLGRRASSVVYGAFLMDAYVAIVVAVWLRVLPTLALLGLITLPLAVAAALRAYRYADDREGLLPAMGWNVVINIATPLLVAVGLLLTPGPR